MLASPALALGAIVLLQGCGAGVLVVMDGSRQASGQVIGEILAETTPGIAQDQGAACIHEAMTWREIVTLGTGDSTDPSPAYRSKVAVVRMRPGVTDCLAAVPVAGQS